MERSSPAAVGTTGSTGPADPADPADAVDPAAGPLPEADPYGPAEDAGSPGSGVGLPGAAHAWAALGGDPALLERVSCALRPGLLPARLPVLELARCTVAVCSLAAAELASLRSGSRPGSHVPPVRVDDGAVATAFTSERHLRTEGRASVSFAPFSRFWPTADGWLRTHANYPHHRTRLFSALGITETGADETVLTEAVAAELAGRAAAEVEETVYAAGGLAVAARAPEDWAQHPQGAETARRPLLTTARLDKAPPLPLPQLDGHGALHGLRVLDLTRVIAGPVATRTLALFGADVLRVDAPQLPESRDAHADTGMGKRSTLLDLSSRADQATFEELLSAADVVVTGYRPGALDRFGLAPESLADRQPGVVVGQLSAWGTYGPWHRRRGFDSLVQVATGIAATEAPRQAPGEDSPGAPSAAPGVLPAQALDHSTGYLLAAAVLRALTEQRRGSSGSRLVRLALSQTAHWLQNGLAAHPDSAAPVQALNGSVYDPAAWLSETDSPLGRLRHALPPVGYEGAPAAWSRPPGLPGADPAAWW